MSPAPAGRAGARWWLDMHERLSSSPAGRGLSHPDPRSDRDPVSLDVSAAAIAGGRRPDTSGNRTDDSVEQPVGSPIWAASGCGDFRWIDLPMSRTAIALPATSTRGMSPASTRWRTTRPSSDRRADPPASFTSWKRSADPDRPRARPWAWISARERAAAAATVPVPVVRRSRAAPSVRPTSRHPPHVSHSFKTRTRNGIKP